MYVYFIVNSKNATEQVAASYAFDQGPFTHAMASEAWELLHANSPGLKVGIDSGKMSCLLSHESPNLHINKQGQVPEGARLNY